MAGSHTHCNSDSNSANLRSDRKQPTPMGDTRMNCSGVKKRSSLNGHSSATPLPPVVSVSNRPCETMAINSGLRKPSTSLQA